MSEQNKALARRFLDEVFNQGRLHVVDEVTSPNATFHDPSVPGGTYKGLEGQKQFVQIYRNAFPDLHIKIDDQIAEGEQVCTRWTATGTHKGEMMGILPTDKHTTVSGIDITRFENGKVVEAWVCYDMLGMLQQLGVVPTLTPAGAPA
jgi:steroid delta-isomerase-like uncharacterized protein